MHRISLLLALLFGPGLTLTQVNLDSLRSIWEDASASDTSRANAMYHLVWEGYLYSQPDSGFYLASSLLDFARGKALQREAAQALKLQGIARHNKNDYSNALDFYQKSLDIFERLSDKEGMTGPLNNIGLMYFEQGLYTKALSYFQQSLALSEEIDYQTGIANAILNIGNIYLNQGDYSNALASQERSLQIYESTSDVQGIATCLQNIANIYLALSDFPKALQNYQLSLEMARSISDKQLIASNNLSLARYYYSEKDLPRALDYAQESYHIYQEMPDHLGMSNAIQWLGFLNRKQKRNSLALEWCQKGLQLAENFGFLPAEKEFCNCLYYTYKAMGKSDDALKFYERAQTLKDSLKIKETAKQLQQMEFARQVFLDSLNREEEKRELQLSYEAEVRKKNRTRNVLLASALLLLLISGGLYSRYLYIAKSRNLISKERDRSDHLLLNILPAAIAAELKEKGSAEARDFDQVTILFTDFKEFTRTASNMSAKELVDEINFCFEHFDHIVAKYRIEKIKTIGDAYMAAGGLPIPDLQAAKNTVLAALEMQDFIRTRKAEKGAKNELAFEMRVGIHTGPVVAGIVGVKKFQYDIWGDTVNIASRMEFHGEVGHVNISQATYLLLKDDPGFLFIPRDTIDVKGKGLMDMWFVQRAE